MPPWLRPSPHLSLCTLGPPPLGRSLVLDARARRPPAASRRRPAPLLNKFPAATGCHCPAAAPSKFKKRCEAKCWASLERQGPIAQRVLRPLHRCIATPRHDSKQTPCSFATLPRADRDSTPSTNASRMTSEVASSPGASSHHDEVTERLTSGAQRPRPGTSCHVGYRRREQAPARPPPARRVGNRARHRSHALDSLRGPAPSLHRPPGSS
jgi:hypothetical protein